MSVMLVASNWPHGQTGFMHALVALRKTVPDADFHS